MQMLSLPIFFLFVSEIFLSLHFCCCYPVCYLLSAIFLRYTANINWYKDNTDKLWTMLCIKYIYRNRMLLTLGRKGRNETKHFGNPQFQHFMSHDWLLSCKLQVILWWNLFVSPIFIVFGSPNKCVLFWGICLSDTDATENLSLRYWNWSISMNITDIDLIVSPNIFYMHIHMWMYNPSHAIDYKVDRLTMIPVWMAWTWNNATADTTIFTISLSLLSANVEYLSIMISFFYPLALCYFCSPSIQLSLTPLPIVPVTRFIMCDIICSYIANTNENSATLPIIDEPTE